MIMLEKEGEGGEIKGKRKGDKKKEGGIDNVTKIGMK